MRPGLEYGSPIWSPFLKADIDKIENVQRSFTRRIPGFRYFDQNREAENYLERLNALNVQSLEERRLIADLVLVHKMVYGYINLDSNKFFELEKQSQNVGMRTRGHPLKLSPLNPSGPDYRNIDCRKFFFSNRIYRQWNNLPALIVLEPDPTKFNRVLTEYFKQNHPTFRGRAFTV